MSRHKQQFFIVMVLLGLVAASAIGVIYSKHQSRQLVSELQHLQQLQDELHVEWSQLVLEQGTWATHSRVERIAREHLDMFMPQPGQVEVLH